MIKLILLIICCLLVPLNYWICEYFYPGLSDIAIHYWWLMRMNLVSLTWLISAISHKIKSSEKYATACYFLTSIWIALTVTDVFERYVINDRGGFTKWDLFGISIAIAFSYYEHYYKKKNGTTNRK